MNALNAKGELAILQKVIREATVLRQVVTNVLTHVPGGTVAANRRGIVYGIMLSNLNATACTVAITDGATNIAMGPFYMIANDHMQIPVGGLSPLAPVGFISALRDMRARCSTAGTNISLNAYYFHESRNV